MNKYQRRYQKRKSIGTCVKCGGLRDIPTSLSCQKCVNEKKARLKKNQSLGLCGCGNKPTKGKTCDECKRSSREYARAKVLERTRLGLCFSCDIPNIEGIRTCYQHCLETIAGNIFHKTHKWTVLNDLLIVQNNQCAYCQTPIHLGKNAELDHIQPKSRFPELIADPTNLQWLCVICNTAKSNLTESEFIDWLGRISTSLKSILQN